MIEIVNELKDVAKIVVIGVGGVGSCKSGTAYLAVRRKSLFSHWWTL